MVITDPNSFALREPTREEIAFVASAISQGVPVDQLDEFVTSIGGRDKISETPGAGAMLARQFVVAQNVVPADETSLTNFITVRSGIYGEFDDSLNSRGSVYNTDFFGAAEDVTGPFGLGGAQIASALISNPFNNMALADLKIIGVGLYNDVNRPTYEALYYGNANFVLASGTTVAAAAQGELR